jgi:uncharacterized protein
MAMGQSFLDAAKQGKTSGWLYLWGTMVMVIFLAWGFVPVAIFAVIYITLAQVGNATGDPEEQLDRFLDGPTLGAYLANHVPYLFWLFGLVLVMVLLHQRSVLSLVSSDRKIRFHRLIQGFGVWLLLLALQDGIGVLIQPQSYRFSFNLSQGFITLITFVLFILVFTPLQTTVEELFFRGYLLQGLGRLTYHPLVLSLLGGMLFALPHLANPEMERGPVWMGLQYGAIGVFWVLITLRDNRLELALGGHAANNLYIALVCNTPDSALQTPSLFLQVVPFAPQISLLMLLIMMGIAYGSFFSWRPVTGNGIH